MALLSQRSARWPHFKTVMTVKRLPKTRSGENLRGTMRQIADGEPWKVPATHRRPRHLEEVAEVMRGRGVVKAP
jgi:propionyl-CoA synthetase